MSEQMAAQMYAELVAVREMVAELQKQLERLTLQFEQERAKQENHLLSSIIGLGDSGLTDVSERHDYYIGQALADEHLR